MELWQVPNSLYLPMSQTLEHPSLRRDFLNGMFDVQLDISAIQATNDAYQSFFARYATLCKLALNKNTQVAHITHAQLLEVVMLLKDGHRTRDEYVAILCNEDKFRFECDLAEALVEVAASVWLMLSIGNLPGDFSYYEPISWEGWQPLWKNPNIDGPVGVIDRLFSLGYVSTDLVKLPQTFTAAHLEKIGGIEIRWTRNLADHLLLTDDDTKLMLFHQVSFLQLHKLGVIRPLPADLVIETMRSISLLLPPSMGKPNSWFEQERQKYPFLLLDAQAGICGRLNSSDRQIDTFSYWRDRLVLLKRTFDDAEPRNLSQLWWDDRKKTQWFTFWVAVLVFIMTVFFGVIQSVTGIVQAWASVQSLKEQSTPTSNLVPL
ncbi:hypothetical protein MMC28_007267 [Mycoblastus sanguinarius]|nr:hypothetical protein [Mycoblastus sanguinarius]